MKKRQEDALSPLTLFYSYAREDEALRDALEKHLSLLHRQGLISSWSDRQIVPGTEWSQDIDAHLDTAEIILLLISPDFLASDYCYSVEMQRALERHAHGEAYVIPIILRPVDWQGAPFAFLQGLPRDMKPVTSWSDQDEAFLDIARGLRWTIEHLRGTSEVDREAVPPKWRPSSLSQPNEHSASPLNSQDRRNRQHFLTYLRARYRDVQEQSLQGTTLITLGLRSQPEAIAQSAQLVFRHLNQPDQILPPGTSIEQVYQRAGGELLLLGEAGAGKSTLLLHLAEDLLSLAERDEREQIPVILNLSSWGEKRLPLREWLVEEVYVSYQVPHKLGKRWVNSGQFLFLLDGLDEVAASVRGACINAINAYRRDYLVSLVVCSRSKEYLEQQRRLLLQSAVVIQPLTENQIEEYVAASPELTMVRTTLQQNPVLRELATLPLLLNVLILAYRNIAAQELPKTGSSEEQQRQIFGNYIARMLQAERVHRFPQQYMLSWLTWLAQQMRSHNLAAFYIEQLQSSWLSSPKVQLIDTWIAVRLPGMLMGALLNIIIIFRR
jgi:eukaryotic-like serine/threonine-protein kinase